MPPLSLPYYYHGLLQCSQKAPFFRDAESIILLTRPFKHYFSHSVSITFITNCPVTKTFRVEVHCNSSEMLKTFKATHSTFDRENPAPFPPAFTITSTKLNRTSHCWQKSFISTVRNRVRFDLWSLAPSPPSLTNPDYFCIKRHAVIIKQTKPIAGVRGEVLELQHVREPSRCCSHSPRAAAAQISLTAPAFSGRLTASSRISL